jgi:hypothetical protein
MVPVVNIRLTSSLTADDENRIAPALLNALTSILNLMPIAYVLRIDTSDATVYQHVGTQPESSPAPGQTASRPSPFMHIG